MTYVEVELPIKVNSLFSITIQAVNQFGSLDVDYSGMAAISLGQNATSDFTFENGTDFQQYVTDGVSTWYLTYPVAESFSVSIQNEFNQLEIPLEFETETIDPVGENELIGPGLLGNNLIVYLRDNYKVKNSLGYDSARDRIFMIIDNKKVNGEGATQNTLECVYTGLQVVGYSSRTDAQSSNFNTEHSWPQSKFDSANPMVSDIHHLYPTDAKVNSDRGNLPFEELSDAEVDKWYLGSTITTSAPAVDQRSLYSKLNTGVSFEPRDEHKGNLARSMFYFWTMYATNSNMTSDNPSFFNGMKNDLLAWHRQDRPDVQEVKRSDTTAYYQGNRNPFVHDTTLVVRAYFPDQYVPVAIEHHSTEFNPVSISLEQNYPNPFNPSTTIQFHLDKSQPIQLLIYDMLGRKVAILVNTTVSAGFHQINFNATNLSSGLYIYTLESAETSISRKMSLIK